MASYLRPRRGKRATARTTLSGTNVLKKGEIFFECDNGPGGGQGRIMMGDGSSNYSALTTKYFLDFDSAKVAFTNVTASNSSSAATPIGTILPTNTLATCLNGIKQSLLNLQGAVTALNNEKVDREAIPKTINNQTYVTISKSEFKKLKNGFVVDVNIGRTAEYGYHYVTGHAFDSSGTLYVYFDGSINTTVNILIHFRNIS